MDSIVPDIDLLASARRKWRPRDARPMQEWCDENLYLPKRYAYLAGPWDTMAFPHQRGVMWLLTHPHVREIYLQWGTRLGKTVLCQALLAHAACNDPAPAMYAGPDRDRVILWFDKMYSLLEESEATRHQLIPKHARRFPVIDLDEMQIVGAWSGSVSTLGEQSIKLLVCSEIDKWLMEKSREADPLALVRERTKDWPNSKIVMEGTPTVRGLSRIDAMMRSAEIVMRYHVPCPHCGEFQWLEMGGEDYEEHGVKWERKKDGSNDPAYARRTAFYRCRYCREKIRDDQRGRILRRGVWAPIDYRVPSDVSPQTLVLWGGSPRRRIGLQLPSLYQPPALGIGSGAIAEAFLLAKRRNELQNFVNSWLAEVWHVVSDVPEWQVVRKNLSTETPRSVAPNWVRGLTAGIDIGKHRNHYVIRGWGVNGRSQLIEAGIHEIAPGTPIRQALNETIYESILDREIKNQKGAVMRVRLALVDSGYSTDDVYATCKRSGGRARPVKGEGGRQGSPPFRFSIVKTDSRTGRRAERGQRIVLVDADYWKDYIFQKISLDKNDESAWLFHADPQELYVRQICAVAPVPRKDTRGREKIEWKTIDDVGDHWADAENYAAAAAEILGWRDKSSDDAAPRGRPRPSSMETPNLGDRRLSFREIDFRG